MSRFKDTNWNCGNGASPDTVDHAALAVQMDIRDELKLVTAELRKLNNVIQCPNFIAIPQTLKRISSNTANLEKRKKS